jgi:hypothetical protein
MAKKHVRSGKPTPGGRVTPKGVRPDGTTAGTDARPAPPTPPARQARPDLQHGRRFVSPPAPTRAGHHRGQR